MFCKNCGQKLEVGKKFCTNCGTPSPINPVSLKDVSSKEPWTARKIIRVVLIVLVVGLILGSKLIYGVISAMDSKAVDTNNNALNAYDSGNSDEAITQFQQASQDAVSSANKMNSLINLAYVYASNDQNTEALSTFKQALPLADANSYEFYLITGEIAYLESRPADALSNYQKANNLKPDEFQANNALTLFYMDVDSLYPKYQDYPKALPYALKASQESDLQTIKSNLGVAYYFNDDYTEAISVFKSVTINQDTSTPYFIGLSYYQLGDDINAKFYLKKAIAGGQAMPQAIKDYANS